MSSFVESPAQMLCFALYTADHAMARVYRPLLEPFGLTYPQYIVIMELADRTLSLRELGMAVTIISRDKDLAQLLYGEADRLWHLGDAPRSASQWREERGVDCATIADFLAVAGDAVDDIPGLRGVGDKTATIIFQHYRSLEAIYANLDGLAALPVRGAKGLAEKFILARQQLFLFRQLCRLRDDVPLPVFESPAMRRRNVGNWIERAEALGFTPAYLAQLQSRYPRAFTALEGHYP